MTGVEGGQPDERDPIDDIAAAVLAVPGVSDLHAGMFGEVATYLPGRRVSGIRLQPDLTEVHLTIAFGSPVRETADAVRRAVAEQVGTPVHVTVEDVVP
ncbi:hypothetical protein ASD62_10385 [Phycicoccus sp. Root563]|uniref:Asp23/Gls24 family envelope stress response protein n=1 Tax=unclassified Phycicoccus TaxID=2637926 RepID=UPI000703BFC6|nr:MULTISPECIES: Asp23/Gls24 family envelope stress response protein [unclassified Phycicoccus]KQU65219.1 hypothetical protein ASC58_17085 [Phycicoccus sp. Root101]KQZ89653.1 hypothetical protein ASD62_10385 [Phycicoccus sp. Root563]